MAQRPSLAMRVGTQDGVVIVLNEEGAPTSDESRLPA